MKNIDTSFPIMVTGATGYVAGWIVKKLMDKGYTVHAPVRSPEDEKKTRHLRALAANSPGSIEFFKADLLEQGSYDASALGCEVIIHTASPFFTDVSDPQKQLVEPALEGTRNVLATASKTSTVKRVVLTSSCAAIYTDASELKDTPNGVFTEEIWNETASLSYQPYSYSKTVAEREAWKIAGQQRQWDLVVLNPSLVMGPALNPESATSESVSILKQLASGAMKSGAPNMGVGVVDIRDLADAHLEAAFRPEAQGRHIISGHNSSFLEMAKSLHKSYGDQFPIPNKAIPKWLIWLVGPFVNKAFTRRFVANNVNHEWKADNSKSKQSLGITYRPFDDTMRDSFKALTDAGVI